jgi:hypothetical protein
MAETAKRRGGRSARVDTELAWELADAAKPCLDRKQRNQVYIAIGVGDVYSAVKFLLQTVVQSQVSVGSETLRKLNLWVASYRDYPDEARLRDLIGRVTIHHIDETPRPPAPPPALSTVMNYRQPNRRIPPMRKTSTAPRPISRGAHGHLTVQRVRDAMRRSSTRQRSSAAGSN